MASAKVGSPAASAGRRELGDSGLWLGLVPLVLVAPFALPWLDPPAEHGALLVLAFLAHKVARNVTWVRLPPWRELAAADGLAAFLGVLNAYRRRETGLQVAVAAGARASAEGLESGAHLPHAGESARGVPGREALQAPPLLRADAPGAHADR